MFLLDQTQRNYKLVIAYDGTPFVGWQVQPNGLSIQELLETNSGVLLKTKISLSGSGRTDAGVHALGQVANFQFPGLIDKYRFLKGINALLPQEVKVLSFDEVPLEFHARFSAVSKTYAYNISLEEVPSPFFYKYRYRPFSPFSLQKLEAAAKLFIGTHDFTSFANKCDEGSASYDAVRTVKRVDLMPEEWGLRIEFEANGFLYKMVRNMTGALIECARGKVELDQIKDVLTKKDRKLAWMAAPSHALFLMRVQY